MGQALDIGMADGLATSDVSQTIRTVLDNCEIIELILSLSVADHEINAWIDTDASITREFVDLGKLDRNCKGRVTASTWKYASRARISYLDHHGVGTVCSRGPPLNERKSLASLMTCEQSGANRWFCETEFERQ